MAKFKVIMNYSDGTSAVEDEIFDTEAEAAEYGLDCCSNYHLGAEILHLSNPGDNPLDEDDDVDFEVIEVDD